MKYFPIFQKMSDLFTYFGSLTHNEKSFFSSSFLI